MFKIKQTHINVKTLQTHATRLIKIIVVQNAKLS